MTADHQPSDSSRRKTLLQRLGALSRSESGFTAVEFAMVIGPFLALLFAIMEVAFVYFATFSLENATGQAARMVRTGEAHAAGFSATEFKAEVCEKLPGFMNCADNLFVDVRSFPTFAAAVGGGVDPIDDDGALQTGSEQFSMGAGGSVVLVSIYYNWSLFASMPDFGLGLGNIKSGDSKGNRLIMASTAFKNEPFD